MSEFDGSENLQRDTDRVGLSEEGLNALNVLMSDGNFKDRMACYRFATSVALKENLDISGHTVNRPAGHMYLQSQIDPEGFLGFAIAEINPRFGAIKYRALERYADLGVRLLAKKVEEGESILYWMK